MKKKIEPNRRINNSEIINNPTTIIVFSDDLEHKSCAGSAHFRKFKNSYGFLTHKSSKEFYTVAEYKPIYDIEIGNLYHYIASRQGFKFIILPIGSKRANENKIFEEVINKNIKKDLSGLENIEYLW